MVFGGQEMSNLSVIQYFIKVLRQKLWEMENLVI
jgi:hypothetical protein